jgi:hypothetical protein
MAGPPSPPFASYAGPLVAARGPGIERATGGASGTGAGKPARGSQGLRQRMYTQP